MRNKDIEVQKVNEEPMIEGINNHKSKNFGKKIVIIKM